MAWATTSRHERGYGSAWDKIRKVILQRDKHMCQACLRRGKAKPGNHVDHIKPKAKGGTDAEGNLETLCKHCHDIKTTEETGKKFRPRSTIGIDGWPT